MGIIKKLRSRRGYKFLAGLLLTGLLAASPAQALPEGASVVHGNVVISGSGQNMTIQQATQQAIINWNGFSINTGEMVRFMQPSQLSAVLNRVTGLDASVINGILQGNGNIFLINPNGVLIGPGGTVNAGGFLASTLEMSNADFLSGNMTLKQNPNKDLAAVINQGTIQVSDGGFVVLTAPSLANEGVIIARSGDVKLGAGTEATVNFDGQGLVNFALNLDASPGQGTVIMSRADANNVLAQAVNSTGVQEAGSLMAGGHVEADSVSMQATGDVDLTQVNTNRTGPDLTVTTTGDVAIGSYFALDGHNITVTATGDITFDTLVAEIANGVGGVVKLSTGNVAEAHTDVPAQTLIQGPGNITMNPGGSGIAADRVELVTSSGSINTAVAANTVSARAPNGNIGLSLRPGVIDGVVAVAPPPIVNEPITPPTTEPNVAAQELPTRVGTLVGQNGTYVSASAGGDVSINSVNTVYVEQISGRNVTVSSQTGSVVDAGDTLGADNRDIIASQNVSLSAQDFLGTIDNALEVEIQGDLDVTARRDVDGISGLLLGFVGGEYRQGPETAGVVLLNPGQDGENGLRQALHGVMDNNNVPGDDTVGGGTLTSLFFLTLYNGIDDDHWLEILRGSVVWEDSDDEAEEDDF